MTLEIDYDDLFSRFDNLVNRKIIHYAPPKKFQFTANGFPLEFHISPSLLTKPQYGEPVNDAQPPECFGPGSDIANTDPELLVTAVCKTHLLVVNKFPVFRPQLLLLTTDSYRRQHEPLTLEDFAAVCSVLNALGSAHYAIYNCCPTAGASRQHKHLQILPRPSGLFPDCPKFDRQAIPYRYFLQYLPGIDFSSQQGHMRLFEIYQTLLAEGKGTLGEPPDGHHGSHFPHNVVLVGEWIVVIPRQTHHFEGVTANGPGMMGSIWLTSEAQMELWKQVGPTRALSGLGVPMERGRK